MIPFNIFLIPLDSAVVRFAIPDDADEVVVTFESAHGGIQRNDLLRKGFGEKFLSDNRYAVISILPLKANWYRPEDIKDFLSSDKIRQFISRFKKAHAYGVSMGAYGALAYADVLGVKNIVAIAPVTTLAPELVPWEKRFRPGATFQWTGSFADGCEGIKNARSIWALYDDKCPDFRHVERIERVAGQRLNKVVVPGVRHSVAVSLSAAGILKKIALACLQEMPYKSVQSQILEHDIKPLGPIAQTPEGREKAKARVLLLNH